MSHAANLRNRQRSLQESSPAKRRKLSVDQGQILANGSSSLINGHGPAILAAAPAATAKSARRSNANFAQAVVTSPDDEPQTNGHVSASVGEGSGAQSEEDDDISSDDDEADIDDDEDPDEQSNGRTTQHKPIIEGEGGTEAQEPADSDEQLDEEATEEPTFGELLRARASGVVDVEAAFQHTNLPPTSLLPTSNAKSLTAPTATSLSTVLTQALRTNDADLLESCFHVPDLESIRATIERLHSSLAVQLVQRLAERMHRRPGRAGSLMVWVQWTVVAHGGYLASQPAAMKHLRTLYKVVKLRATGLQPLLALKGKLDMLEAQMQMRRNVMAAARAAEDQQDEAAVVYLEGEEEDDSDDADADSDDASADEANLPADEDDPDALLADLLPRRIRQSGTRERNALLGNIDVPILNGTNVDDEAADDISSDDEDDEEDDDSSDDASSDASEASLSDDEQDINYDDVDEAELGSEDDEDEDDDDEALEDERDGLAVDVDSEDEAATAQVKRAENPRQTR